MESLYAYYPFVPKSSIIHSKTERWWSSRGIGVTASPVSLSLHGSYDSGCCMALMVVVELHMPVASVGIPPVRS